MFIQKVLKFYAKLGLIWLISPVLSFGNAQPSQKCGVLSQQKIFKYGVDLTKNKCREPNLSSGTVITLKSGTSIRLKVTTKTGQHTERRLICQNLSKDRQILSVLARSPWLEPNSKIVDCSAWLYDRMECRDLGRNKTALICAFYNVEKSKRTLKTKPPKMRGTASEVDDMELATVENVLKNHISPKIDRCRKEFHSEKSLTLAWTIKSNGVVVNPNISEDVRADSFVDCAVEAIEDFIFPAFKSDIPYSYRF
jgi:ribosomal protein L28